jgi:hypothetical protein
MRFIPKVVQLGYGRTVPAHLYHGEIKHRDMNLITSFVRMQRRER